MSRIRRKIQTNFSKAATQYEEVASVQKSAAKLLVDKVFNLGANPHSILDLGAGTGFVTEELFKYFPLSNFTLNDLSPNMLDFCKNKFKHNNFYYLEEDLADVECKHYDLIISNFALQWVENLETQIIKLNKMSDVFAFTTLTKGTFSQWHNLVGQYQEIKFIEYPEQENVYEICMRNRHDKEFYYWVENIELNFANATMFMKYLKKLGAKSAYNQASNQTIRSLLALKDNFTTSYQVFFGVFK